MPSSAPRPNLFVVGDAKCGTTTLYRMLQLAGGVGTSRTRKELHYFSSPELLPRWPARAIRASRTTSSPTRRPTSPSSPTFPRASPSIADVSPSYLQEPPAAGRIAAFAPDARIVILLREPAAKVMSQYTHLWSEGRETLPFEEAFAQQRGPTGGGLVHDVRLRGRRPLRRGGRALPRGSSAASG